MGFLKSSPGGPSHLGQPKGIFPPSWTRGAGKDESREYTPLSGTYGKEGKDSVYAGKDAVQDVSKMLFSVQDEAPQIIFPIFPRPRRQ